MSASYRIRPLHAFLLLLSLPGCTGGAGEGQGPIREERIDGGVRVVHRRVPGRSLEVREVGVWEVWEEGAPWTFGEVSATEGGAEDFFLLDGVNLKIVVLDPEGRLVRTFGREGAGPGELRVPLAFDWTGEHLWVSDVANRRFTLFDERGDFVSERRWPGAARLVGDFIVRGDGRILHAGLWPLTVAETTLEPTRWYLSVHDLDEPIGGRAGHGLVDTLAVMFTGTFQSTTMESLEGDQRGWFGVPVFDGELLWDARDGMLVTVTSRDYRFQLCRPDGSVRLEVVGPESDLTVTGIHRDWYFTHRFEADIYARESFTPTAATRERIPFAEQLPAIRGIALGPQGRVWVQAQLPAPGASRLDVFDADGEWLGTIPVSGCPVAVTGRGDVLLREDGEGGLDRFRVVRPYGW
jgi:hypothetical protein